MNKKTMVANSRKIEDGKIKLYKKSKRRMMYCCLRTMQN
jgi:hypothetical protein